MNCLFFGEKKLHRVFIIPIVDKKRGIQRNYSPRGGKKTSTISINMDKRTG